MGKSTDGKTQSSGAAEPTGPEPDSDQGHGGVGCPVAFCPICLAVSAVQPIRPDVVEHLLKAGSEFFLAMRAVVDARAEDVEPERGKDQRINLEKIDIG